MKLNRFSKLRQQNDLVRSQLKSDLSPIIKKYGASVIAAIKRYPKTTFWIMVSILTLNIAALLIFSDQVKPSNKRTIWDWNISVPKRNKQKLTNQHFMFTLKNIREMKALKDSLKYLMSKQQLSYQDTLLFIRLSERLRKIDTGYHPLPIKP